MTKLLFACSVLLVFTSTAGAVGMGRVSVLSLIGQRLHVEIEIISVDVQERGALSAKLGSARDYEQSRLTLGAAGSGGIRVSVERRANGEPYVRVTSVQPIYEPFVNLLIELMSPAGPITREFSVLLDPPELTLAKSAEADTRPPAAATEIKTPAPAPVSADSEYGPVRRGETLFRIATKVRPSHASVAQTMAGIFRNNPAAFINNNMNLLKAGHRLRIPAADQIAALSRSESAQAFREQAAAHANRPAVMADARARQAKSPPREIKVSTPATSGDKSRDVLKLSRSATAGMKMSIEDRVRMLEEDLAARERALSDARERIRKLEEATAAPAAGQR